MYKLSREQGQALSMLALTLRPDWSRNKPGQVIWDANEAGGIQPAEDFTHCVRALVAYCDAKARMRTPVLYPEAGLHWASTVYATVLDPDDVLGKDYWSCPNPPQGLSIEDEMVWKREQRRRHDEERLAEARLRLENRGNPAA